MPELVGDLDLIEIEEFAEYVMLGAFSNYDGWGYYSDGIYIYDVVDLENIVIKKNKYIAWANK